MTFNAEVPSTEMKQHIKTFPATIEQGNKPYGELPKFAQRDKIKNQKSNEGNEMSV